MYVGLKNHKTLAHTSSPTHPVRSCSPAHHTGPCSWHRTELGPSGGHLEQTASLQTHLGSRPQLHSLGRLGRRMETSVVSAQTQATQMWDNSHWVYLHNVCVFVCVCVCLLLTLKSCDSSVHCSWLRSHPVGLCAHACSSTSECSGICCTCNTQSTVSL